MQPIARKGKNHDNGSRYARAEDVMSMLDPLILEAGFSRSLSTKPHKQEGWTTYVLILRHNGGHEERHEMEAPIDDKGMRGSPTKTRVQGAASTYTYCERHLLCKVFGVQLVKDDDGRAGAAGPGAAAITLDQSLNLESLMDEVLKNRTKFLELLGIKQISDLPAGQYRTAVRMLEAKR